jgi:hypothetical protein
MEKKTTAEAVKALGLTRKILWLTLVYHPELRPAAQRQALTRLGFTQTLWSDAEIERVRLYRTTHKWLHAPA